MFIPCFSCHGTGTWLKFFTCWTCGGYKILQTSGPYGTESLLSKFDLCRAASVRYLFNNDDDFIEAVNYTNRPVRFFNKDKKVLRKNG